MMGSHHLRQRTLTGSAWATIMGASFVLLAGCSSMSGLQGESHYACQAPVGVACDSVSGTYANAVRNNLPGQRAASKANAKAPLSATASEASRPAPSQRTAIPTWTPLVSTIGDLDPATEEALRSPHRVLRLWTQAWEDRDGDLHDQAFVYVLIDAGQWRMAHIRQQARDPNRPALRVPPTLGGASTTPTDDASHAPQLLSRPMSPNVGEPQRPAQPSEKDTIPASGRMTDPIRHLQRERP